MASNDKVLASLKNKVKVIEAFQAGKEVESKGPNDHVWKTTKNPCFENEKLEWRIKKEIINLKLIPRYIVIYRSEQNGWAASSNDFSTKEEAERELNTFFNKYESHVVTLNREINETI